MALRRPQLPPAFPADPLAGFDLLQRAEPAAAFAKIHLRGVHAIVFLVPLRSITFLAAILLVYSAVRHSLVRNNRYDRRETGPQLGGPSWSGGVSSSIM